jgi:sodium-dependent dicarboxylate transporter 2/3/5
MLKEVWAPKSSSGKSATSFLKKYHYLVLVIIVAIAGLVAFGPTADGLSLQAQRALGIFTLCVLLWVTSIIPLQITSLLAIILLPMLGVLTTDESFALFGNEAVFFILGAFIMSSVLVECGISTRLTCFTLRKCSRSAVTLRNAILFFAAFFSFWMSEHAVAAIFFPIVLRIVTALDLKPMKSRFGMSFFFALAWGCVIGGIATYLGGARNPLAAGILFEETGTHISFLDWLAASAPVVAIMLLVAFVILQVAFKPEPVDLGAAKAVLDQENEALGRISQREIGVSIIFLVTIVSWVTLHHSIGLANIALASVVIMFVFRLIDWATVEHSVNWGIILMYGGAIALGSALNTTGAAQWIVDETLGTSTLSPTVTLIIIAATSLVLTEFISNAAVVSVLLPVAISIAQTKGISLEAVTLAVALPSGLTYTLPMGTPATAIAYSSGYMKMKHFLRIGPIMGVISLAVFALVATFIWPLMGV